MPLDFDYKAARAAGYSDDDILNGLKQRGMLDFDLDAARKAGYSSTDIMLSLAGSRAEPAKPEPRNAFAVANDTVIELANAIVGGLAAVGDFASPGNRASKAMKEFIQEGESKQSDVTKAAKSKFRDELAQSDTIKEDLSAVGGYIKENPLLTAAQAVGSFVGPGIAVKGATATAGALGATAKGATLAGRGAGVAAGAAMGGGDAAGDAYDLAQQISDDVLANNSEVKRMLASGMSMEEVRHEIGTIAARKASVLPAIAGGVAGAFGAEKLLAGGAAKAGVLGSAKAGLVEGAGEAAEEGLAQFEGRRAAQEFDPSIDPTKNVAAMAAMGGVMGFGSGAAINGMTTNQVQAVEPGMAVDPEPEASPLLLENKPDPMISFPDGTVGRQSEVDNYIAGLPEDQQVAARARLMGMAPQEMPKADVADIQNAVSVDEAIAVTEAVISAPTDIDIELKNRQIDEAFAQYRSQIQAQQQAEFEQAEQARREQEFALAEEQRRAQEVEQANIITDAQGFDAQEPTAMELAMRAAQERRALAMTPVSQRTEIAAPTPDTQAVDASLEVQDGSDRTAAVPLPVLDVGNNSSLPPAQEPMLQQGGSADSVRLDPMGDSVTGRVLEPNGGGVPVADGPADTQPALNFFDDQQERRVSSERRRVSDMTADELRQAVLTSPKTGLPNLTAFEEAGVDQPTRNVLYGDLDDFKSLNDKYGHDGADQILKGVGALKAKLAREMGVAAYHRSGDEFLAAHPETDKLESYGKALQSALADTTFKIRLADGSVVTHEGVGFSYGTGQNTDAAESRTAEQKELRRTQGLRRGLRGTVPEAPGRGQADLNDTSGRDSDQSGRLSEAVSLIEQSDIPTAERIKLRAALRRGDISPDDIAAELAQPVSAPAPASEVQTEVTPIIPPLKSTAPKKSGSQVVDVERAVAPLRQRWKGFDGLTVVQRLDDVPANLRADLDDSTEAIYDPESGKAILISDNIKSPERAAWVATHEVVGHGGLRRLKDKSVDDAVKLAGANRFIRDLSKAIAQDRKSDEVIEEAIAELSAAIETDNFTELENRYGLKVPESAKNGIRASIARVFAAVKRILSNIIGKPVSDISDSEVRDLIRQQRKAVETHSANVEPGRSADTVMASKRGEVTESAAFKKWFGDSKVLNTDGTPKVVYHGTNVDFDRFDPSKNGSSWDSGKLGKGFYFSTNPRLASNYANSAKAKTIEDAPSVMPVYVSIKNPLKIGPLDWRNGENLWDKLRDFSEQAGIDIDPVSDPQSNQPNPAWSGPFREALERFGYDGVLLNFSDGHQEVVAFNPSQIKSATGNNGNFDPKNPSILQSRAPSSQWAVADAPKVLGLDLDDIVYSMQNKQVDMKKVVSAIKKASGDIKDRFNPYLQEELFHGRAAKGVSEFLDTELRPMLEEMRMRGVEMSDFEEYLWNRHAEERNKQIASLEGGMQDGGSGIKTADARKYLSSLSATKLKAYESLAKRIDAINAKTRQILVESGLEKQSTIDSWQAAYKHYVPLQREDVDTGGNGTGQGFSIRGSSSKRAVGSNKPVADIIANIAMQREKQIVRAEKNRVSNALLGLAKENPNSDFWTVDDAPTERVVQTVGGEDKVVERIVPGFRNQDNVVLTRIDGEDHFVIFNERDPRAKRMAMSIKNLDADQLGRVLSATSMATRYFASINTQYNPIFGVINLIRDTQGALLNLSTTPIAGDQKKVLGYTYEALRGIYSDLRAKRSGKPSNSAWADLWEEFQTVGGQTGYRNQYSNAEARAEKIASEIKALDRHPSIKAFGAIRSWLSDYNETMENGVRLAAYRAAKERGLSNEQAASLAKNLTVNFNRKGQVATQMGALYAFFNASVQGTARLAETLSGPAGKKIIYGGILLGSMQAMLLAAAGMGEDEPPEFVRSRNLILPIGDGKYLTLPMPLGFHVLPNIGRIPTEFVMSGFKNPTKRIADFVGLFADTFNPIGNAGISLQTISPTVVDPLAALSENRDWTGKPIAKQDFNPLSPTPGYTRAKDTATSWSKGIAYALNILSGGTDYKQGLISPTPDQLDYLIGQATGGVGREISKLEQTGTSMMTGEELPMNKIPLFGRFVGDTKGQSAEGGKFYESVKRLNSHEAELKGLRQEGNPKAALEYLRDNPEARLVPVANRVEREVQKLRKAKREAVEKDQTERVKMLEKMITARMKALNDRIEKLQEEAR
jgi:diguanylate cyclase (GGDEF)-like protein